MDINLSAVFITQDKIPRPGIFELYLSTLDLLPRRERRIFSTSLCNSVCASPVAALANPA
jgi:hypothetical protein